jgi:hypothetical protein
VRAANPVAAKLAPVAQRLPEVALLARELNESLKAQGFPEGLQTFLFLGTAATARFDRISHILPSYQLVGTCAQYAEKPVAGCNANFTGGAGQAESSGKREGGRRKTEGRRPHRRRHHRHAPSQPAPPSAPAPAIPHVNPPSSPLPSSPLPSLPDLGQTLDYLLGQ